jgi:hypothetical protein
MWEGFEVVSIGKAEHTNHRNTSIIDLMERTKGSPVYHLARVLRVDAENILRLESPATNLPPSDAREPDEVDFRVVVGYDYWPCYRGYWSEIHGSTP